MDDDAAIAEAVATLTEHLVPRMQAAWRSGGVGTLDIAGGGYVQWGKWPEGMQTECSAGVGGDGGPTFVQRRRLADLGFQPVEESGHPNPLRRFHKLDELPHEAETLARAAVLVHGWRPPEGTTPAVLPPILVGPLLKAPSDLIRLTLLTLVDDLSTRGPVAVVDVYSGDGLLAGEDLPRLSPAEVSGNRLAPEVLVVNGFDVTSDLESQLRSAADLVACVNLLEDEPRSVVMVGPALTRDTLWLFRHVGQALSRTVVLVAEAGELVHRSADDLALEFLAGCDEAMDGLVPPPDSLLVLDTTGLSKPVECQTVGYADARVDMPDGWRDGLEFSRELIAEALVRWLPDIPEDAGEMVDVGAEDADEGKPYDGWLCFYSGARGQVIVASTSCISGWQPLSRDEDRSSEHAQVWVTMGYRDEPSRDAMFVIDLDAGGVPRAVPSGFDLDWLGSMTLWPHPEGSYVWWSGDRDGPPGKTGLPTGWPRAPFFDTWGPGVGASLAAAPQTPPASGSAGEARHRVADLWDDVIGRWLEGDTSLPDDLLRWRSSYAGDIDDRWYPDPFVGDLRGETGEPRVVVLGLNPGVGYAELQARNGIWAQRIREQGYSRTLNRVAFDDPDWIRLHGRNSPYWTALMRFARRWTDDPTLAPPQVLNMELYAWHSDRVERSLRPPADILDHYVWQPLSEVDVPHVFAFGAHWFNICTTLGWALLRRYGPGYGPVPGSEATWWNLAIFEMPSKKRAVVSWQAGFAGPPGWDRLEALRHLLG